MNNEIEDNRIINDSGHEVIEISKIIDKVFNKYNKEIENYFVKSLDLE